MTKVVILGAGPAGLAAAVELSEAGVSTTLIEREPVVGGNAASFRINDIWVDYGSHRLHPASDPAVLSRIRGLLGEDLLTRPRHGRIRLMGRWIHFPLRPMDLLLRSNPRFSFGVALDLLRKFLPGKGIDQDENFATVLRDGLGRTICEEFYFPYARKIWGLDPSELSAIQARKRVSAGSIGKMLKRLLPGGSGSGGASTKGIFYYPRRGFGQISESLHQAALDLGTNVLLDTNVAEVQLRGERPKVIVETANGRREITADQVYSTIPVTVLAQLVDIDVPDAVRTAAKSLEFRSMVLVYLELDTAQFTEFDAHYFPGAEIPFTRMSEPANYSGSASNRDRTVLCIEVPCFVNDATWNMSHDELSNMIQRGLAEVGLPIECEIVGVDSRRIPFAYPLYRSNYEQHYNVLDDWVEELDNVLSFGRQGLYAHDNTHHAIYMAIAAAESLGEDGSIDQQKWRAYRKEFEKHVVED